MPTDTHNMTLTRTFDAPVEVVWKAWSTADQVMRWWGPTHFTSPLCTMDFREGGTTLVCMRTPDGHDMYNTWRYHHIVPMERIEFVQHFSDVNGNIIDPSAAGLPEGIPAEVPHVLTFTPTSDGKTDFTVTEFGYATQEVVEMSSGGMSQCLDKMEILLTEGNG